MSYGDRLEQAITLAKSSRKKLASDMGLSVQAVGDVINGKTKAFTAQNNSVAAQLLGVDGHWLATGVGIPRPTNPAVLTSITISPAREDERGSIHIEQFDTGGAMGHGVVLQDQPGVIRRWVVSPEWVQQNVHRITSPKNLAIVTGFGDSMRPLYNPGDPLLLDRGIDRADIDGIYFFRVGDEGFVKRLQRIPTLEGVIIRAKSENPRYDPFDIVKGMDFEVFGRVVKAWRGEDF